MTSIRLERFVFAVAITAMAAIPTACASTSPSPGGLGAPLSAPCPQGDSLSVVVAVDGTSSFRSPASKAANLKVMAEHITTAAYCGGSVRVFGFASSTGATQDIFASRLSPAASTDNARRRKAEKLTEQVMAQVSTNYDPALDQLAGTGTDVLGMLAVFREAKEQVPGSVVDAVVLTDGLSNIAVNPVTARSTTAARALTDTVSVPDLTGSRLSFVGIGREAPGAPELPSAVIERVRAFWQRVCERTHAASCLVATDGR